MTGEHPPTFDLYHQPAKRPPTPFDTDAAFAGSGSGHVSDYDEPSSVRKIDPVQAQQERRNRPAEFDDRFPLPDDGARLFANPSDHRRQAVDELRVACEAAIRQGIKARGWAAAINYHDDVKDKLSEAIESLNEAVDLLGVHEE